MRETHDSFDFDIVTDNGQVYAEPLRGRRLTVDALREMLTAVETEARVQAERALPRTPGTSFIWNGERYVTMRTSDAAPAFPASQDTMGALFALKVSTGTIVRWETPTETHRSYPFRLCFDMESE